jgi:hypothetical protein
MRRPILTKAKLTEFRHQRRKPCKPVGRNSETYSAVFPIILYAVNAVAPRAPSTAVNAAHRPALDFKRFRIARGVPEGEHVNGVVVAL